MRRTAMTVSRMWTGVGATILRDAPFSAIYWTGYENMKRVLKQRFIKHDTQSNDVDHLLNEHNIIHFVSGATSGACAALLTHPIDVIKTRIQAQYNRDFTDCDEYRRSKHTIRSSVRDILHRDGYKGLFRGLAPRVLKVAPSCAIMISSYELFKNFYASIGTSSRDGSDDGERGTGSGSSSGTTASSRGSSESSTTEPNANEAHIPVQTQRRASTPPSYRSMQLALSKPE